MVLLTREPPSDPFLVDYVEDLREQTKNELIYAEQVDLSSLHSIRLFATKWVDNAPPRRLDMIILCAATMTPPAKKMELTLDGLEVNWAVNYIANCHLLSILSPAIRAQPPDRDVRIIIATCSTYMGAQLDFKDGYYTQRGFTGARAYGASKFALMMYAQSFQRHLDAYVRPDKQPNNARVVVVDPGWTRTPGMRRWLSMGTLWGLLFYIILWPLWWLILKSPEQGSQSFLMAAMDADLGRGAGGRMIKECQDTKYLRVEIGNKAFEKQLWRVSEKQIEKHEKEGALKRAEVIREAKKKEHETAAEAFNRTGNGVTEGASTGTPSQTSGSRRNRKLG